MTERPARLSEIDGLRGLAALGVALFHLRVYLDGDLSALSAIPGSHWILIKGWHLVDLFFVLSGFIFSHCYLQDGGMRPGVSGGGFAWARFARLWPLHLAVLSFTALVMRDDPGTTLANFALSLAMLHAFLPDIHVLNPPAWSLSVECVCYAIFALIALRGGRGTLPMGSALVAALGAALILTETMPDIGRGLYGFFVGCLVYRYRAPLGRVPWPILIALLSLPFVLDADRENILLESGLSWPAAILLADRIPTLNRPTFQWLGSRSYALYLSHVPLFVLFGNLLPRVPGLPALAEVVICLAATLYLADILYRRLEMPAQAFLLDWRKMRRLRRAALRS